MSDESWLARHFGEVIALATFVIGGVWAALKMVVARHVKKLDEIDDRVDALERSTVSRPEHESAVNELRKEMRANNEHFNKRFDDTHKRLDDIYKLMLGRD